MANNITAKVKNNFANAIVVPGKFTCGTRNYHGYAIDQGKDGAYDFFAYAGKGGKLEKLSFKTNCLFRPSYGTIEDVLVRDRERLADKLLSVAIRYFGKKKSAKKLARFGAGLKRMSIDDQLRIGKGLVLGLWSYKLINIPVVKKLNITDADINNPEVKYKKMVEVIISLLPPEERGKIPSHVDVSKIDPHLIDHWSPNKKWIHAGSDGPEMYALSGLKRVGRRELLDYIIFIGENEGWKTSFLHLYEDGKRRDDIVLSPDDEIMNGLITIDKMSPGVHHYNIYATFERGNEKAVVRTDTVRVNFIGEVNDLPPLIEMMPDSRGPFPVSKDDLSLRFVDNTVVWPADNRCKSVEINILDRGDNAGIEEVKLYEITKSGGKDVLNSLKTWKVGDKSKDIIFGNIFSGQSFKFDATWSGKTKGSRIYQAKVKDKGGNEKVSNLLKIHFDTRIQRKCDRDT